MVVPCAVCGYDAPGSLCPHCGEAPREGSLRERSAGTLPGLWAGSTAVPRGLLFLLRTRGIKRWLLPPLVLTTTALVLVLTWGWRLLEDVTGNALPDDLELGAPDWEWLAWVAERWQWLAGAVTWIVVKAQVVLSFAYGLATDRTAGFLLYVFSSFLVAWYVFSIAYEAFAGPFLDEIQGRLESKWFGRDPRSSLERPTDIPPERCFRISLVATLVACAVILASLATELPLWIALACAPAAFLMGGLVDPRYPKWLAWIAKIEGRAVFVSIKASLLTGLILSVTWPVYFLPFPVGYVAFAMICGFATAVSLLDIPCERRDWSARQRLGFVKQNLAAFTAFGTVSGLLLSIPVLGPLLMVPSASIGGLWLLCRLDKSEMRNATRRGEDLRIPPATPSR